MMETGIDQSARTWFHQRLRTALGSLYDPSVLGSSPLLVLLGADQYADEAAALRFILLDAIESLRPSHNIPKSSRPSRVYEILRHRFTEQQTQSMVADIISLSIRQLQREEKSAVIILADYLWRVYHLEDETQTMFERMALVKNSDGAPLEKIQADLQEWDSLIDSIPFQQSNIVDAVQDVITTLRKVSESAHVSVDYQPGSTHSQLYLQAMLLRQGLLNILSSAIELLPGGIVKIQTTTQPGQECVVIQGWSTSECLPAISAACQENLDIALKLVQACKGSLKVSYHQIERDPQEDAQPAFSAEILLPTIEQIIVLVVEDNADTLQLYQRYLADSRYRFIGARDVKQGMALAVEDQPKIIILDVMMPESDGWALLGQLRVHPKTLAIPIIVCSIIPQANLALTLGAAGFLRKPVSRADLLAALDHQMGQMQTKPG